MYTYPYGTTELWEWLIAFGLTAVAVADAVVLNIATAGTASILVSIGVYALTGATMVAGMSLAAQTTTVELGWGNLVLAQ